MVSRLEEIDAIVADEVHEAVLLCDAAGPATLQVEAQRLGLPDPPEWVPHRGLDEIEDAKSNGAVGADPGAEVRPELRMEHGEAREAGPPILPFFQGRGSAAALRGRTGSFCAPGPSPERRPDARRFSASAG